MNCGQPKPWQQDDGFTSVRSADALKGLPLPERNEWLRLWDEVDDLLTLVRAAD
jgi:hypothetical protein